MKFEKPGKKEKKAKTEEEATHLNLVASHGCMICGKPSCVHHIRRNGERRDHYKTIPLCLDHHQGPEGIHTLGRKAWVEKFGSEEHFLKILNERKKCP